MCFVHKTKMIAFTIFSFAIISFAIGDPISLPPPLSQGVDSFQREVTKREAQRAEAAPAPGPPGGQWIPGVNCRGRRKREAQRWAAAPAPGDPDDNLPPCPGGGGSSSCYTERGQLCQFPFSYNGKTYYECTTDSSNNGKAWCAYGYRYGIEADTYKLEDCQMQSCDSSGSSSERCECSQKTNSRGGGRCQTQHNGRYYCYVNRRQCRETIGGFSKDASLSNAGYYVNYSLCN